MNFEIPNGTAPAACRGCYGRVFWIVTAVKASPGHRTGREKRPDTVRVASKPDTVRVHLEVSITTEARAMLGELAGARGSSLSGMVESLVREAGEVNGAFDVDCALGKQAWSHRTASLAGAVQVAKVVHSQGGRVTAIRRKA